MSDFVEGLRISAEALVYCVADATEALVKGFKRGWALGMARRVR